jgi:two-component system, LytTR family, sensor kinase
MERTSEIQKPIRYPSFGLLFVAWTVLGALACARYVLLGGDLKQGLLLELLGWLACYYPWLFATPLIFRLELRFPIARNVWPKHVALLALASVPLVYFAYETTIFSDAAVRRLFGEPFSLPHRWWSIPGHEVALEQALYWFTVGASCMIRNLIELRKKERLAAQLALEKSEMEASLRQAELETLRMRLNPHFLFNSLQNISILAQQDAKTASQMLTRLGDLLRVALRRDSGPETTLETEIALTQAYVAIEKMRFGDRLAVLFDVAPGTDQALVPTFLLQPLVENAIKHGLGTVTGEGLIAIGSAQHDGELILTIRDNGTGLRAAKISELEVGIGLGSTCDRLARMYPGQHQFFIQSLPEGGTEVRVGLPFRTKAPQTETPSYAQAANSNRR